jgi:hypothetical protein
VGVALDEAGNRQTTLELDHLGAGSDARIDLRVAPDRDDLVAGDGNRL